MAEVRTMDLPEDFTEKMKRMLGEEWQAFAACYDRKPYQALRFNPLKKGLDEKQKTAVRARFGAQERVPWEPEGFYYDDEARPGKHVYHEAGLYYIQEPSAMSAAALLAPERGMRVLDLCAAPGGKTAQLAARLGQSGLLVANEIHPARCKILSGNVERMGIANAIVTNEDSGTLAERFPLYFHAVLADAPCSGEGMFRKNPEAGQEWSKEQVNVCARRQREILENAAGMLLPGGTLVYSTCTFSGEENEENIDWFLEEHPEFRVKEAEAPWFTRDERQKTFRLWPHKLRGEGHFVAVLVKEGSLPAGGAARSAGGRRAGARTEPDREQKELLKEFVRTSLSKEFGAWLTEGRLILFGGQLYRLPEEAPDLGGVKVLRAGLHVGELKKNRFEPSHALALYMGKEDAACSADFFADDERLAAYINGESVFLREGDRVLPEAGGKGWCLICVDGCSAGWGKLAGGQIKNHYPKGLRRDVN